MPVPPWPSEDHVCLGCGFSYGAVTADGATAVIARLPADLGRAVAAVADVARRPAPQVWCAAEYACHLRDVVIASTIRLHRVRTEDRPELEPMLNDLRARRFRYASYDMPAVVAEVGLLVPGLLDEIDRIADPGRTGFRAGDERTASWLVRHAAHEVRHHLADIRASGS